MFLLKSLIGIRGHDAARQGRVCRLSRSQRWTGPLLFERLENRPCLSTQRERVMKRHLLIATLFGIVMAAVVPCAHADLYVISYGSNSVLRYNEMTGAFIDKFVSFGSSDPRGLLIGHDGNLYLSSFSTNTVMRYDGTTGAPLPAPGQTGAVFAPGR